MTIGRLTGGRAVVGEPHYVMKTGEGTLRIGDGRDFGGKIIVKEGTLEVGGKPIPSFEDLPSGAAVHFDASDTSAMTFGEGNLVTVITNIGENLCDVRQTDPSRMPILVRDSPKKGLNLLDFDGIGTNGRGMSFSQGQYVATVVAVVDARIAAGGNIADQMLKRRNSALADTSSYITEPIIGDQTISINNHTILTPNNSGSKVWVNGLEIAEKEGYEAPALSVVAYRVPACYITVFGARSLLASINCGGLRIGEFIAWRETLTDEQIRDVQAYLSNKWLDRTLSGYASEDNVLELQDVTMCEGTVINVPSGRTANIGKVSQMGRFRKCGGGTLVVHDTADFGNNMVLDGGSVVVGEETVVDANCEIAPEPSLHLDPSRADMVKTFESNGTNFIWTVQDPSGKGAAANISKELKYHTPWLTTDVNEMCNGLSVIDFGPIAVGYSGSVGCWLNLSKNITNTRAVYFVYNSDGGGGQPLGWRESSVAIDNAIEGDRRLDFYRGAPINIGVTPLFASADPSVTSGQLYINGVAQPTVKSYIPKGGWELVELHTVAGAQFNCFGNGFQGYIHGGFRLGEVIVYERPLSERERVATRNYLLKKWFGKTDEELETLPEESRNQTVSVGKITVEKDDGTIRIENDIATQSIIGDGVLDVGSNSLEVKDISQFEGALAVDDGGTLLLTGKAAFPQAPSFVEEGRILHLEANSGMTVSTNISKNTFSVEKWDSLLNDGWSAYPGPAYNSRKEWSNTNYPSLIVNELNDLNLVKMYRGSYFIFCKDGEMKRLENIQSAFWVIGSQEGGGYLLGGGNTDNIGWHRGGAKHGTVAENASDGLFHGASFDSVEYGSWRLNGNKLEVPARTTGLSGGYDVLSFVMNPNYTPVPNADGLAMDARFLADLQNQSDRLGNQRLAELVIYNRMLSADEVAGMESYLQQKWGLARKAETNTATVELNEGATLECKVPQYINTLSGSGNVRGDIAVENFVADCDSAGLSINGTLTIAKNPMVELKNLPDSISKGLEIVIAKSVSKCVGLENLQEVQFIGDELIRKMRVKVRMNNGVLSVRILPAGFWMVVR